MNQINAKIIQAVIDKAQKVCPGALALVGVYGSVATGDTHAKSDLDLLILIEDERGRELATGMILEDADVGYDLYCTTWENLRCDAEINHAHVAKLMDCQVVYEGRAGAYEELCRLRARAEQILRCSERYERAEVLLKRAKMLCADICLTDELGKARVSACYMIDDLASALMLYHGRYFHYGTRRMLEELAELPDSDAWIGYIKQIAKACDIRTLCNLCRDCLRLVQASMQQNCERKAPSAELAGTYEEMYSNWRNKVVLAAETDDAYSSFANLSALHAMLAEISQDYAIPEQDVMHQYHPGKLTDNAEVFDRHLQAYERVYQEAGICVKRYADVDAFVQEYLCQ